MSEQSPHKKPEIMSPAGYWPQLHAAIEAGADSVYFGLKHFTARAKVGFSPAELPEVIRTLRSRGVRGYVTFNTLVFDHELPEAAKAIAAIAQAGADALIVQDVGVLRLAREIAPDLELHASTQMSITDAAGVAQAQRLGVSRVTLARELSLEEIRSIRSDTSCELEIFVHGALCVAYSGQCFSSEAWGGRSANRGQCAQACRLPYELLVDGRQEPLGDARYLLSPGDLYALRHVPEIVEIGISALKIEGRYKDAEYVALATDAYRRAVDDAWTGRDCSVSPIEELRLEQVYSRGRGAHFLTGTNHQNVVRGRAPRHRGTLAGVVTQIREDSVVIRPEPAIAAAPLKPGDGIVFDAADWRSPQEPEEGGPVYTVSSRPDGFFELGFAKRAVDFSRIRKGDLVWRTADADVDRAVRPFIVASAPVYCQTVNVHVIAEEGAPLRSTWSLEKNPAIAVNVETPGPLPQARNRGLDLESVREQFGRLGNTAYELGELKLSLTGSPFAPASLLNNIRREAIERIASLQSTPRQMRTNSPEEVLTRNTQVSQVPPAEPNLHLLVRTAEQLEAALRCRPDSITLDYLDLYGLKPSVERIRRAGIEVRVATPRIFKPGEERVLEFLQRLEAPLLVRAAGALDCLQTSGLKLTGDFSLNIANAITAEVFLGMGLARFTPGYDLNGAQVAALAREIPAERMELIVWGHMPVFHTEHCVFCRFLSTGTSYKDCGRPCEKHQVSVRDASGRAHPVVADVGCRNTVFGAEAQEASAHLQDWLRSGIRHFRFEFAHESATQVEEVAGAFRRYLSGERKAEQLARSLRRAAPQGTTEGSLFVVLQ